jgi:hypothetical protein
MTVVDKEQLCGHISMSTKEHAIMEEIFSVWSVLGIYNKD